MNIIFSRESNDIIEENLKDIVDEVLKHPAMKNFLSLGITCELSPELSEKSHNNSKLWEAYDTLRFFVDNTNIIVPDNIINEMKGFDFLFYPFSYTHSHIIYFEKLINKFLSKKEQEGDNFKVQDFIDEHVTLTDAATKTFKGIYEKVLDDRGFAYSYVHNKIKLTPEDIANKYKEEILYRVRMFVYDENKFESKLSHCNLNILSGTYEIKIWDKYGAIDINLPKHNIASITNGWAYEVIEYGDHSYMSVLIEDEELINKVNEKALASIIDFTDLIKSK